MKQRPLGASGTMPKKSWAANAGAAAVDH